MSSGKMSIEQAIRLLHPETTAEAIAEIKYYGGFHGRTACVDALYEASLVACEALEKQIPKKPVWKEEPCVYPDRTEIVICLHCPVCGELLNYHYTTKKLPFCAKCGQAIDWSEE
jgi:hypothetical protein